MRQELKQYLQKELQAKRFLTDGVTMLEQLEQLEGAEDAAKKRIEGLKKYEADATAATKKALDELHSVQNDIAAQITKSKTDFAAAKDKADALVKDAQRKCQEMFDSASADEAEIVEAIKGHKQTLADLEQQTNAAQAKLDKVNADLAAVLKKHA